MRKLILILLGCISLFEVAAQDPQYTQFYANPLYLNPAFAGATGQGRASVNYRNQWPQLDASYVTYSASYDQFVPKYSSGFGIFINNDRVTSKTISNIPALTSTTINGYYSYVAPLNKKLTLQMGLSVGVMMRDLGLNNLLFTDEVQINPVTGAIDSRPGTSQDFDNLVNNTTKTSFDAGTGLLLYSKDFWVGASINHINQPNIALLGGTDPLFARISVHGGYTIGFSDVNRSRTDAYDFTITPAFMYMKQGASSQFSLGAYFNYQPLLLGFWYRGLPINQADDSQQESSIAHHDAVAILAGVMTPKFTIGYSYDLSVGNTLRGNTGGAHEISLTFNFGTDLDHSNSRPRYRKFGKLYCPNPWKQYEKRR